jgi:hypothetical protein
LENELFYGVSKVTILHKNKIIKTDLVHKISEIPKSKNKIFK